MSQNNFTNVIKLVPILIEIREIAIKRLELRSPRDSNIESFTGKERFKIEKIVIIFIDDIWQHLIGQSVQVWHNIQRKIPFAIWLSIY